MKITLIENKDNVDKIFADIQLLKNPNVFQSLFYYNVMSTGNQTTPKVLIAEVNGITEGLMLIQVQNYFSRLLKQFSSRSIISGGPIFNGDEKLLEGLLETYNSLFKSKVLYTQFRNIFDISKYEVVFTKHGFKKIEHLNYIVDLNEDMNKIWENVYSKRKNEIRKGIKEGIKVREIEYDTELESAYNIVSFIYVKAKLPLPDYNYFKNAKEIKGSEGIFRILGGYIDSKLVGVIFLLCFEGRVYNWYAASYPDYYNKYPNDVIIWEAIKWSFENGYQIFDFGGAGNPAKEYGVRDFKKKFGGIEVNYGRYECVHKPTVMKLSEYGFKLWQKLK